MGLFYTQENPVAYSLLLHSLDGHSIWEGNIKQLCSQFICLEQAIARADLQKINQISP